MKFRPLGIVAGLLGLGWVVLGCGGGGGGGGSSSTSGNQSINAATVQLVGVYPGTQSPANLSALNIGDKVNLEYVGQITGGYKFVVTHGGGLSTTVPSQVATLSGGTLSVVGSSNGSLYSLSGTYGTTPLNLTVGAGSIGIAQRAKVSGLVEDAYGDPVFGATVLFFNSGGEVASTTTGIDGSFLGEVPPSATSFAVDLTAFSATYYNEYVYGGSYYSSSTSGCLTPLPPIVVGKTVALPNTVVPVIYDSGDPPPPPTGCG